MNEDNPQLQAIMSLDDDIVNSISSEYLTGEFGERREFENRVEICGETKNYGLMIDEDLNVRTIRKPPKEALIAILARNNAVIKKDPE